MGRLWPIALISVIATAVMAQRPMKRPSPTTAIMMAAVSRDQFMFTALSAVLTDANPWTHEGTVVMEPLGLLTPSGKWKGLPCSSHTLDTADGPKKCVAFGHRYLSKPHVYTVISADGNGAIVRAAPTNLSECYDYGTTGTYSDVAIRESAIAASSAQSSFAKIAPPRPLRQEESVDVYKALKTLIPKKLDTTKKLHLFEVRLEGHNLIVIQRTFREVTNKSGEDYNLIFAIATLDGGRFHILHWKQNTGDEDERILGTIALKNGREFLVTTVSDPEGHWYHVYGIRAGYLALVYTGGGSSC